MPVAAQGSWRKLHLIHADLSCHSWNGAVPPVPFPVRPVVLRAHFRMKFRAALRAPRGGPPRQHKLQEPDDVLES